MKNKYILKLNYEKFEREAHISVYVVKNITCAQNL